MIWTSPLPSLPPITKSLYDFAMEKIGTEIQADPSKKALISASNGSNAMTFQQLKHEIQRVEAFLHKFGFRPGDVAFTIMQNSMSIMPFFLGVIGRGGIFSGMNPLLTEYEISSMIREHDVQVILTTYDLLDIVLSATKGTNLKVFPSLTEDALKEIWKQPQLLQMPMYHLYGNFVFLLFLSMGASCVIMETFEFSLMLAKIEEYKVFNLFLSPPMVRRLTKDRTTDNYDLSSLRYANSSAAPLGRELAEDFMTKFPHCKIAQGLGMSEALCAFVNDFGEGDLPFGIVGPGYEAKIVCPFGKSQGVNCTGEIVVRGPGVMKGYHKNSEATAEAIDSHGWYRTGDVGYFNRQGRLFVPDRLKELIKVNGLQVAPAQIGGVLVSDRRIRDAAVIGIPHMETGEAPMAFIVREKKDLTEDDVQNIVKGKLAVYKWLAGGVRFVDEIPRLLSGKILRRQLRGRYMCN